MKAADNRVAKALLLAKDDPGEGRRAMFKCTSGIAFFGTPMRGADLKSMVEFLRTLFQIAGDTNKKLLSVFDKSSEELRDIQLAFRKLLRMPRPNGLLNTNVVCFFEALKTPRLGLVSQIYFSAPVQQFVRLMLSVDC